MAHGYLLSRYSYSQEGKTMFPPAGSTRNLFLALMLALGVMLLSFAGWRVAAGRAAKPDDKAQRANAKSANPYIEYVLSVQGEPRAENTLAATTRRPAQASPPPQASKLTR